MSNTMKVTTHYPYSEEFEWETQMVDINLDEERIRDISEGKGFIVKSPKPIKAPLLVHVVRSFDKQTERICITRARRNLYGQDV